MIWGGFMEGESQAVQRIFLEKDRESESLERRVAMLLQAIFRRGYDA